MYASVSRPGKSPPWPPIATSPPATHRPRRGRTLASVKRHACGASDQLAATGRISHVADVVPHWPCLSMTCSRVQRVRSNAIASSSVSVHSGGRVKALKRSFAGAHISGHCHCVCLRTRRIARAWSFRVRSRRLFCRAAVACVATTVGHRVPTSGSAARTGSHSFNDGPSNDVRSAGRVDREARTAPGGSSSECHADEPTETALRPRDAGARPPTRVQDLATTRLN